MQQTGSFLTKWGSLSSANTKYLVTGVAISATLLTTFIGGRIQHALLRRLATRLRRVISTQRAAKDGEDSHREEIVSLNSEWRAALGINGVLEKIKFLNFVFAIIFTLCGLITAVIATVLTPTVAERQVEHRPLIPDGNHSEFSVRGPAECVGMVPPNIRDGSWAFRWALRNDSIFRSWYRIHCGVSQGAP